MSNYFLIKGMCKVTVAVINDRTAVLSCTDETFNSQSSVDITDFVEIILRGKESQFRGQTEMRLYAKCP